MCTLHAPCNVKLIATLHKEFRHAVASTTAKHQNGAWLPFPLRRSALAFPRIHAFLFAAVFEFFLEWRRESSDNAKFFQNSKYLVKMNSCKKILINGMRKRK